MLNIKLQILNIETKGMSKNSFFVKSQGFVWPLFFKKKKKEKFVLAEEKKILKVSDVESLITNHKHRQRQNHGGWYIASSQVHFTNPPPPH